MATPDCEKQATNAGGRIEFVKRLTYSHLSAMP